MSKLPKYLKIKPGHEQKLKNEVESAARIANGSLGWSGIAELFMMLGVVDNLGLSKGTANYLKKGNKRIRKKKMKRFIQRAFIQSIFSHTLVPGSMEDVLYSEPDFTGASESGDKE